MGNPTLALELGGGNESAAEALMALPGVVAVDERGDGHYLLEHNADSDPREAVFGMAVEKGWVLLQLTPQQATLEDVFVRLTTREEPVALPEEEVSHA